jgi:hypothetical protein
MKREQGTPDPRRRPNPSFAKARKRLAAVLPVAKQFSREDISHSVSTAFRNLIADFG